MTNRSQIQYLIARCSQDKIIIESTDYVISVQMPCGKLRVNWEENIHNFSLISPLKSIPSCGYVSWDYFSYFQFNKRNWL